MADISERLRRRRKQLRLSQEALAEIANIDQTQISRYEKGKNEPGADVLASLANALNTTTDWLLGLTENPNRPAISKGDLSEDERELIDSYRGIPADKQRQIRSIVRAL